jgi:DNA repair exonuclease SbcCD ATPase subunit
MSTIGKIFLFLNFALAFGFLFWASTELGKGAKATQNFATEQKAHRDEAESLNKDKTSLSAQLTTEKNAKDDEHNKRLQAESESNRNKADLDQEKRANEQLRADIAGIKETLGDYNKTIQGLNTAKDAAVAESRNLERDRDAAKGKATDAEKAKRDAEEALKTANLNIADLERKLKTTKDDLAKLDTEINSMVVAYNIPRGKVESLKQIEAKVVQVDYSLKPGLVALNVGSNAGVTKGYTFAIYSGTTYKGEVKVEMVHADMCSALITSSTATIGAGDSATTHL